MEMLLFYAYTVWAIYSGYKVLTGWIQRLDKREPLNIAVKVILSIGVGYIIAVFYAFYSILKFLGLMSRM